MKGKVLVLGASDRPERFAFRAVKLLLANGYDVIAVGNRPNPHFDTPILTRIPLDENIDTVCLYLNPERQKAFQNQVIRLSPQRIIFNPGTENPDFAELAQQNDIQTVEDCTLVMLNSGYF